MPVNNVDKRMEGKGTMKVAEKDPLTHIDLELMDNMKRVFDEAKKEGFKGTFKDFLDTLSEEDLKTLFLEKGGLVAKVKEPKAVKKLNIAEYFAPGKTVSSLNDNERSQIKAMLNKMLKGVSAN